MQRSCQSPADGVSHASRLVELSSSILRTHKYCGLINQDGPEGPYVTPVCGAPRILIGEIDNALGHRRGLQVRLLTGRLTSLWTAQRPLIPMISRIVFSNTCNVFGRFMR
jgi:hypothetical protein